MNNLREIRRDITPPDQRNWSVMGTSIDLSACFATPLKQDHTPREESEVFGIVLISM